METWSAGFQSPSPLSLYLPLQLENAEFNEVVDDQFLVADFVAWRSTSRIRCAEQQILPNSPPRHGRIFMIITGALVLVCGRYDSCWFMD